MKRMFTAILAIGILALSGCATTGGSDGSGEDLSWWGNTGAGPSPVKDSSRSGYWWWPTEPASNENDEELWGNRGIVYNMYNPTPPPSPPPAPEPPRPPVTTPPPKVSRTVPVFNNVLFDFDKSSLKDEGRVEIDKVVSGMKEYSDDSVTLIGHTDSVNRSGDPNYNVKLGQRRADAVTKYMVDSGVAAGRVSAESRGAKEPAVNNDTPENRGLNRRVVFQYSIQN